MNKHFITILALTSTMLVSCSKSGGGGSASVPNTPSPKNEPLESELTGVYQALLSPLNKKVSGHLDGALTLVRENDDLIAEVRFANGPASSMHIQNIHIGDRCPDETDDLNGDEFVDAEEAALVHKEIIIPLDDDLSTQWLGAGTFPGSDSFGYYNWTRATKYKKLMSDLYEEDINLRDDYVKLSANKSLNMLGKVVIIRGVHPDTPLPETVSGRGRLTRHMGLPVACGVLRRITHVPGVIDPDDTGLPVPEGETIGGSSGADDGADFSTTIGSETSGNYGEDDEPTTPVTTSNSTGPNTTTGGTSN